MKVVILAGGMGTRIAEESGVKPKPLIDIGGYPILWHIMKIYSQYGFNEFIICLGYKGYAIKDYFHNFYLHNTDVTFDLEMNTVQYHLSKSEPWKVTLIDTGMNTMTGGRIKRIQPYIGNETFLLTYGDGVGDIDLSALVSFHTSQKRLATLTAVQPHGRFGAVEMDDASVIKSFQEKPAGDGAWINAGFFVLNPKVFDYIQDGDSTIWEKSPLETLASDNQLNAFRHTGFWRPMDTLRDKLELENLWSSGNAPWKVW